MSPALELAARVRRCRKALGYTQAQFGSLLGLPGDRIWALEHGAWPWVLPQTVQTRLTQVLGCAATDLGWPAPPQSRRCKALRAAGPGATLGARLARRRVELGLTQADIAVALGVHVSAVCRWERDRVVPRFKALNLLARALMYRVDELV